MKLKPHMKNNSVKMTKTIHLEINILTYTKNIRIFNKVLNS